MPNRRDIVAQNVDDDLPPVVDLTQPLALRSKRTERQRRKQQKRAFSTTPADQSTRLVDLPLELMMAILELLRPSDIFALLRVNKELRTFLLSNEAIIAQPIVRLRYPILERCLPRPVGLGNIESAIISLLKSPDRPDLGSHRNAHQNIPPPDNTLHCTCMTCLVRWNALCAVIDFAHWQDHLDKGIPIPTIPRGTSPRWNQELLARNRRVALNSLTSPLWYARILEAHLDSTTRSIRRHSQNKADQRRHYHINAADIRTGTDEFLQQNGPPTFDYPYARDLYYMLEVFLPGRSWISELQKWVYMPQTQDWHETDLRILVRMDEKRHFGVVSETQPLRGNKYDVPKCPVVEVTEIWVEEGCSQSRAVTETSTISAADIDHWLEGSPRRSFPNGVYARAVRIVWVGEERGSRRVSPSTQALQRLTEGWGLDDALRYARSCFAGVSTLESDLESQVFTVCYHPKLVAIWRRVEPAPGLTPEIQLIIFIEGEERSELHRILGSEWTGFTAAHPMFPALLCSLVLAHGLDNTLEDIKAAAREVEARTGHHRFASRRQTQPAAGELGSLSAQMSGCAAKLATGTRKLKVVEAINDFISQHDPGKSGRIKGEEEAAYIAGSQGRSAHGFTHSLSASSLGLLRHRAQMQAIDVAYVQQRVQVQIAALFHLIAQQDNAIAFDTASATRRIAASSLQDSSSMKMLALVAMFFLPGSFVAALFSAPLFAWDEAVARNGIGVGTRPQFGLFWAVTAPLTALVFALYGLWMCIQTRMDRSESHKTTPLEF
ncbi:hypothetical protein C7999DRAFT_43350 [Corynascus novoguineensis]|uniref:F-box domain-containing protein n=1 Tax=Corynascus novoguineensis TaxID=1126955 RepID=A0AAN7CN22_9PEZI|nr:hypothetical protein C7999DRAFT_43350 [Corynascus novoguineensis]